MAGYAGMVMLLHSLVQCLLLAGTARLCQRPFRWWDLVLSASAGGLYAGVCLLSRWEFLAATPWRLAVYILLSVLTFGISLETVRCCAVFILLNMALEGIITGFRGDNLLYWALGLISLGVLCTVGFGRNKRSGQYVPVELCYNGSQLRLTALRDTGNMLTDPMTGMPVLVVDADTAYQLIGLTRQQLCSPLETMIGAPVPGLRLVPYRTVGQGKSFLLALRMQAKLENKAGKYLVAFAPELFSGERTYQALAGGFV